MSTEDEKKSPSLFTPLRGITTLIGALGGLGLSNYAGVAIWVPFAAAAALALLFALTPLRPRFFPGGVATTTAHLIWFIAVGIVTGAWLGASIHILILAVGIVWILKQPGLKPFLLLFGYEAITFVLNLSNLGWTEIGTDHHKGLAVQCVLGLACVVFLIIGFLEWRTTGKPSSDSSAPAPTA